MRTSSVVVAGLSALLLVPITDTAAQDCRADARSALDRGQDYRNAARDVALNCTKDGRPCTDAKALADAALEAMVGAHQAMVSSCDNTAPPPPPPPGGGGTAGLILNEVDYDQPAIDSSEFVEILNTSTTAISLDSVAVVFINGATSTEYRRVQLSGVLQPGQYAVVASVSVANIPPEALVFPLPLPSDNIQNGAPDAIALVDTFTREVLDALSYEGPITAAVITGFPDPVNLVEGTALPASVADSDSAPGSLIRLPNGVDTDNAATDWTFTSIPTPGAANVP